MIPLTRSTLADAPSGTMIIFSRPEYTCSQVLLDAQDIGEIALTRAPDISFVSSGDALLIGRKQ